MKATILVNGKDDPDINSGYGIIGKHLYPRLGDYYGKENILIYAPVWTRDTVKTWQGMKVLPGNEFSYGEALVIDHYERHGCNILLQIGDCWPLGILPDLAANDRLLWVQWIPVDWLGMPANILNRIRPAHKLIPFTDYGHEALSAAGLTNVGPRIWLGLDLDIWKPIPRAELNDAMQACRFTDETFNILIVGANQQRKSIREALEAIAVFRTVHPECSPRLYLHSPLMGDRDLTADLDELGLVDIECGPDPYTLTQGGFPEDQMAKIFNCADVVINVAMEGFGLAQTQAQACGVPVICLSVGAGPELVQFGWEVSCAGKLTAAHQMTVPIPDVVSIAGALEACWAQRQEAGQPLRSEHAVKWVRQNLSWDGIAQQWIDVIDGVMEDRRRYCMDIPKVEVNSFLWGRSRDVLTWNSLEKMVQS